MPIQHNGKLLLLQRRASFKEADIKREYRCASTYLAVTTPNRLWIATRKILAVPGTVATGCLFPQHFLLIEKDLKTLSNASVKEAGSWGAWNDLNLEFLVPKPSVSLEKVMEKVSVPIEKSEWRAWETVLSELAPFIPREAEKDTFKCSHCGSLFQSAIQCPQCGAPRDSSTAR